MSEVPQEEIDKMNSLAKDLIFKRGEAIHWMTEIESVLDELIVLNFIKREHGHLFLEILLWEDFPLRTKIRLFSKIPFKQQDYIELQSETIAKLEKLSSIRNKFAHRLSLISAEEAYLIDKEKKVFKVDEAQFNDFKNKAIHVLASLKWILFAQQGIDISKIKFGKLESIPIDKIHSKYD